jgi:signal transduction histidine kinase
MCLKKLSDLRHSVAFRLTMWYAGFFAASLLVAFLVFYMVPLRNSPGISHHALSELREEFRHYFGTPLMVIIAISAGVGWFMAKRALKGVEEVTQTAVDITNGALDKRVPIKGGQDEIDRLAEAFNIMVERVQKLIGQMKEITENIAHDLRSPITRMRGIAEMTLTGDASAEEHTAMAGTIIEECDRLLGMINATLDISEAESGLMKLNEQHVDLVPLLRDVCDLFQPSAENRSIEIVATAPESVSVTGDLKKLQRVFSNLADNALKYTSPGGLVTISVEEIDDYAVVTVRDTGRGIPENDLPHIFDRFYRGEKSRSTPGNGLGLSLARALVLAHRGTIAVISIPGEGSEFRVTLPKTHP